MIEGSCVDPFSRLAAPIAPKACVSAEERLAGASGDLRSEVLCWIACPLKFADRGGEMRGTKPEDVSEWAPEKGISILELAGESGLVFPS